MWWLKTLTNALTFLGVLCVALSIMTKILFKPPRFFAPPSKTWGLVSAGFSIGMLLMLPLAASSWLPFIGTSDILNLIVGFSITGTYGQAIYYHFEAGTRSPRDLWTAFFSGQ